MTEQHPVGLRIIGGTKIYPGTVALKSVDFELRMGAVNVLVGENGAGKSTMMKVIAGVEQLTSGRVEMDGREVHFHSTDDAERHGIGIVFQELNLFPNLTVAENIFMAHEKTRLGVDIDAEAQRAETRALMQRLEHDIDPDAYLVEVHDISFDELTPDPELRSRIAALPGRRVVYTNGSAPYAEQVVARRGLSGVFDAVYGVEHAAYHPKPDRRAFEAIFARDGISPSRAAMFEDDPRNLVAPHEMGMRTVHVAPEPLEVAHIQHHTDDLSRFLSRLI